MITKLASRVSRLETKSGQQFEDIVLQVVFVKKDGSVLEGLCIRPGGKFTTKNNAKTPPLC